MIKANNGIVEADGKGIVLIAELSTIVKSLYEHMSESVDAEKAKATIMKAVEIGLNPLEEEEDHTLKRTEELLDIVAKMIVEGILEGKKRVE